MVAEVSVPPPRGHRWRWLLVFFSGFVLWILAVLATGLTRNPNLIPTVIFVGSFLIPATAVIYYLDHLPSPTVSAQRVFIAFLYGGVLGVLAASLLEAWLLQDGPLVYVGVGLIEEFAKVLALLLISVGIQRYTARDGIVLGAAVGFGFAALESSGYALIALFTPHGLSLTNLVFAEVLRGILAPVGHGLWTGILGGALFAAASRSGLPCARSAFPKIFAATMPNAPNASTRRSSTEPPKRGPKIVVQRNGARATTPTTGTAVISPVSLNARAACSPADERRERTRSGRWTWTRASGRRKSPSAHATATL